ncbi:MAG: GspH/FimT family pseudopilin [Planctomycetes bacterium]|nr:GspH/FimT family pseudopilin [Planctomycetota bacterium]
MPSFRRSSTRAFTLVELMVVVVIIAIGAMMTVPYMMNTDDTQVTAAARMITCDLQYAQDSAITSQEPVKVVFDPAAETYKLVWSNTSVPLKHPMTKDDYEIDFSSERGFEGLDVVSASFGGAQPLEVIFDEIGSPDNSSTGTIILQAGSCEYVVSVAPATGRVTIASSGS